MILDPKPLGLVDCVVTQFKLKLFITFPECMILICICDFPTVAAVSSKCSLYNKDKVKNI